MNLHNIAKLINHYNLKILSAADFGVEIYGVYLLPKDPTALRSNYLYFGDINDVLNLSLFLPTCSFFCYTEDNSDLQGLDSKDLKKINLICIESKLEAQDAFNAIQNTFVQKSQLTEKMKLLLDASYADVGLQYIVNVASKVFNKTVFVADTSYKYLAFAGVANIQNMELYQEFKSGYISDNNVRDIIETRLNETIRKKQGPEYKEDDTNLGYGYLVDSVRIHNIEIAHVAVYGKKEFFTNDDSELIHKFASLISIELQKSNFYKQNSGMMYSYLLGELLDKGETNIKNLRERFQLLGHTFKENLYVIVIQTKSESMQIEQLQILVDLLNKVLPQSINFIYKGIIVLFLSCTDALDEHNTYYCNLLGFLNENNLIAGLSDRFTQLSDLKNYYQQAIQSVEIGKKLNNEPAIHQYEEIKFYLIANSYLSDHSIEDVCHPGILLLREYDRKKHTSLLETLKKYLFFLKSPSAASVSLNIHRNTLLYDINKIKSLTGMQLENGDEILNIIFSIKILEYYEKK
jgi:Sugar diacid utilization regulator